jgi:hypothetical protein
MCCNSYLWTADLVGWLVLQFEEQSRVNGNTGFELCARRESTRFIQQAIWWPLGLAPCTCTLTSITRADVLDSHFYSGVDAHTGMLLATNYLTIFLCCFVLVADYQLLALQSSFANCDRDCR